MASIFFWWIMNDRIGTYQAMWFLKKDLNQEKSDLIESMRDMTLQLRDEGGDDPYRVWREDFTQRVEEINRILINVNSMAWKAPEE